MSLEEEQKGEEGGVQLLVHQRTVGEQEGGVAAVGRLGLENREGEELEPQN